MRSAGSTSPGRGIGFTALWRCGAEKCQPLTPAELWAGKQSDDPLRPTYLDLMTAKAVRVLNGLNAAQTRDEAQIVRMEKVLSGLTAMRKEYP